MKTWTVRRLDTGAAVRLSVRQNRIQSLVPLELPADELQQLPWAAPGLFDLQLNGYRGIWFSSESLTADDVETVIVPSMHERKTIMYDQSDAFVVAPGGVGTLEEVIEVLSWKRLDLHSKPVIFLNLNGFWEPLLAVMEHSIAQDMTPASFREAWVVCDTVEAAIAAIQTADDMPHLQHDRR